MAARRRELSERGTLPTGTAWPTGSTNAASSTSACCARPYDPDFARQMALADDVMRDDREVLQALAKTR